MFNDVSTKEFRSAAAVAEMRNAAHAFEATLRNEKYSKLYFFYSHKASCAVEVRGDLAFMQTILDEFDSQVVRSLIEGANRDVQSRYPWRHATVYLTDGSVLWRQYVRQTKRTQVNSEAGREVEEFSEIARTNGARYERCTDRDVSRRAIEFWNCLTLLGWRNRCRGISTLSASLELEQYLQDRSCTTLTELLKIAGLDPAHVLAEVAAEVARGTLSFDRWHAMTRCSVFTRGSRINPQPAVQLISNLAYPAVEVRRRLPPRGDFDGINPSLLDCSTWEVPNPDLMKHPETYKGRRDALLAFYEGAPETALRKRFNLSEAAVKGLIRDCAADRGDGTAVGFVALVKWGYAREYERTRGAPPDNRVERVKGGGWSGLFGAMLDNNPDVLKLICDLVLERSNSSTLPSKKRTWRDVQREILALVRAKVAAGTMVGEAYLLETSDQAYATIRKFCHTLKRKHSSRWVEKRLGRDCKERGRLGVGHNPLFTPNAPFQQAELDFHKIDAKSALNFDLPNGGQIRAVMPRWWIGAVIDSESSTPLAGSLSMEEQTPAEDVLELAQCLVQPPPVDQSLVKFDVTADGKWLASQLMPELAFNGVDLLLTDRAWAHKAIEVRMKLAETLGAVVCFGSVRQWWQRPRVERFFKEIETMIHALPSSVGSGPTDPRKHDADRNAYKHDIGYDQLFGLIRARFRECLSARGASSLHVGNEERLRRLLSDQQSAWLPRPLPAERSADLPLSWVDMRVRVESHGGRSPKVRHQNVWFHGQELAKAWSLVGRHVLLQVQRNNICEARVSEYGTGRNLGSVIPERNWFYKNLTWRAVRVIERHHRANPSLEGKRAPVDQYLSEKKKDLVAASKKPKKRAEQQTAARELTRVAIHAPEVLRAEPNVGLAPAGSSPLDELRSLFGDETLKAESMENSNG